MAGATHHHFVPQFYLRNFVNGVGHKALLTALDLENRSLFPTSARNVAGRRNFNRVNAEGVDPNIYETAYSKWEGEAAPHLKEVIEAREFPSDDHYSHVMSLIALLSVRHPRVRDSFSQSLTQMARIIADLSTATKERWESANRKMERAGIPVNSQVSYEDARNFVRDGKYKIEVNQSYFVPLESEVIGSVLDRLAERTWSFKLATEGATFVTSDNPAVLRWVDGKRHRTSPGHGVSGTMLLFTLSPDLALVGTYGDAPPLHSLSPRQVAAVNFAIVEHAYRQVYMRDASSKFIGPGGLVDANSLLDRLKSRPASGAPRSPA